ncbi:MAG: peptidoglycan DD-metalloendopeptidase family protein [Maritimibacter sp.]
MSFPRKTTRFGVAAVALLALASCGDGLDFDLRGLAGGFSTSAAANGARTAAPPQPDARGVISYPTYQVAVARPGETIAQMAARLGFGANELGRYNGIPPETALRSGEIVALPRQLTASGTPGNSATLPGTIDVTSLAGSALDRVDATSPASQNTAGTAAAGEPVRHQVERGETAYTIARRYGVSVKALADWNSLDSALSVREGQYLLIPTVIQESTLAAPVSDNSQPGEGTLTPVPPSATEPLPAAPVATPAVTPPSPDLASDRTEAAGARMAMPVNGKVVRDFKKGRTDGIDISASAGSPVKAADAGTVAAITRDTDQVPILVIRHAGNVLTVYAGIDNIKVAKGDTVSRGQQIAVVRKADPSFLHFPVREGTQAVDPMGYLN